MNYLYHWVPKEMEGDILYPLNTLKEQHPELYLKHASKYAGREDLLQLTIPTLDCLWNDALHLTAVHPQMIRDALVEAGGKKDMKLSCYEIDPYLLNPENTIVYLYKESPAKDSLTKENFIPFAPDEIEKYSFLPEETKEYYRQSYANGKIPLVFHKVAHILYKGSINVKELRIVETQ